MSHNAPLVACCMLLNQHPEIPSKPSMYKIKIHWWLTQHYPLIQSKVKILTGEVIFYGGYPFTILQII